MANVYQQAARQRKFIYFAIILALFTVSLVHRRFIVEPQAYNLQLREMARGEVELTGSAVRLVMTGSRGLAVTVLWSTALKMQERHQWNEMGFVVDSITKLQPYFITPWLFQSWNISFNVSVENDIPRDKYYYISRGIQLLAEGERRNQGTRTREKLAQTGREKTTFPGHPELRHQIGFYYQLKIGNSDEKNTMRCLLEMSCIDPVERNYEKFLKLNEKGQQVVDKGPFGEFCAKYPRLVRRLREQLNFETPLQVVNFLKRNRELPMRFVEGNLNQRESQLLGPDLQFPLVPPKLDANWLDAEQHDFGARATGEPLDVFLVTKHWYLYSTEPMPPPNPDPGVKPENPDSHKYRMPKQLAVQLFRGYTALAQANIAEGLQAEGWFDRDGWTIRGWFDQAGSKAPVVGTEPIYDSQRSWRVALDLYRKYGRESGLLLLPGEERELKQRAEFFRTSRNVGPYDRVMIKPELLTDPKLHDSYLAHSKLAWNKQYRDMTNFDSRYGQVEAETDLATVLARKYMYEGARAIRMTMEEQGLELLEKAWPLWVQVCFKYPNFATNVVFQEEIYERYFKYLRASQRHRSHVFVPVLIGAAQLALWPHAPMEQLQLLEGQKSNIVPMRQARGLLDQVQFYNADGADGLRMALAAWSSGATGFTGTAHVPVGPFLGAEHLLLTRLSPDSAPAGWGALFSPEVVNLGRSRLGL